MSLGTILEMVEIDILNEVSASIVVTNRMSQSLVSLVFLIGRLQQMIQRCVPMLL